MFKPLRIALLAIFPLSALVAALYIYLPAAGIGASAVPRALGQVQLPRRRLDDLRRPGHRPGPRRARKRPALGYLSRQRLGSARLLPRRGPARPAQRDSLLDGQFDGFLVR